MMSDTMTSRERWLAAIRMQPVDRLPFWPKLDPGYRKARAAPYRDMELRDLHAWVGSDAPVPLPRGIREVRQRTAVETTVTGDRAETLYRTPGGTLRYVQVFDDPSHSWHPVEYPVKTLDDIDCMTAIFEDVREEPDDAELELARRRFQEMGETAVAQTSLATSPLMDWVEHLAGVENGHYYLLDECARVERLFAAMHAVIQRRIAMVCDRNPADLLYLMENTSTTLISPEQYDRYCARHITDYAAITAAAGRNLVLHMCGHIKALLPSLARLPVQAFEAFTSPTVGNTRLIDGRQACPGVCLIGGTNAVLWTRPADEITAAIGRSLEELPHHRGLILSSAGVMPPMCPPETIRTVCAWIRQYPARMG
jgi:hypothetical protein